MRSSSTAWAGPVGRVSTGGARQRGGGFVVAVTLLAGVFMVAAGVWALVGPGSFADAVGFPRHTHFVHDAGAFQLGIGITLLLAVAWRDGLALALAGLLMANTVHTVNHAVDLDLGGRGSDAWGLAPLSLLTAVALVVRLRQLGWVIGEVATATTPALAAFVRQKTVLVTTSRRDSRPAALHPGEHRRRRRPRLHSQLRDGREDQTHPQQPQRGRGTVHGPWPGDRSGRPGHGQAPGRRGGQARRPAAGRQATLPARPAGAVGPSAGSRQDRQDGPLPADPLHHGQVG